MIERIRNKNENFRQLKLKLKQAPRQSFIEIDNILSNVQDKKAFVFLMDSHETEKEITREILEGMLDTIIDLNTDYADFIKSKEDDVVKAFNPKNTKAIILASIAIGIVLAIAFNENIATKLINTVIPTEKPTKGDK